MAMQPQQQQQQSPPPPAQYQQQPQLHQQQRQGYVADNPNPLVHTSTILCTPTLAALFENQRQELDQLCNTQDEQRRFLIYQHRERQMVPFKIIENYYQQLISRKNKEIVQAAKTQQDLQAMLRNIDAEKRELKRLVDEREALARTLQSKLKEEMNRRMLDANDAESSCGETGGNNIVFCPNCNKNSSGVLFMPCRHLSSCKACESSLQACPICGIEKTCAIEIRSLICE